MVNSSLISKTYKGYTRDEWYKFVHPDFQKGDLIWKERSSNDIICEWARKSWNTKYVGKSACVICKSKSKYYKRIRFFGKSISASNLLYFMYHDGIIVSDGYIIDHIDGDSLNNCITNLRNITTKENNRNKLKAISSCGVIGVSLLKNGKFQSSIKVDNKSIYLGTYEDILDAEKSYLDAKKKYHKI